ncbi:MAG: acyl carrier protein [Chlorobaculum sp.]|nr:acyl carrier protein [Chlorobaculum sp.]
MNRNVIESKLKDIISNKMGVNKHDIKLNSNINDFGGDSLDSVEIIMEIENEFGVNIPDDDAEHILTLNDAITYLINKHYPQIKKDIDRVKIEESAKVHKIFISYRREDSEYIAGRIFDRLAVRFGENQIFSDVDSIPLGVDFRAFLDDKVSCCDVFLAVIGDNWVGENQKANRRRIDDEKDFVRIEVESALNRNIPVIPVLIKGSEMPVENELPISIKSLAYRNGIQVRPDPDFHRDIDRLIQGLQSYLL